MKIFLISLFVTIVFMIAVIQFLAVPKLESLVEQELNDLGIAYVDIESSQIRLTGLFIRRLTLGQEKLSTLENIEITLFWPSFFFKREIDQIVVGKAFVSSTIQNIYQDAMLRRFSLSKIANLNINRIKVNNLIWNFEGNHSAYQVNTIFLLVKKANKFSLNGRLLASQNGLEFDINLSGSLAKGRSRIKASIEALSFAGSQFKVNRASGWIDYTEGHDVKREVAGQITSGSGKLFTLPLQAMQLTLGSQDGVYPLIFRAQALGYQGVDLAIDTHLATEISKQLFSMVLSVQDTAQFQDYLIEHDVQDEKFFPLFPTAKMTRAKLQYIPERRFAGGPYPLSLSIQQEAQNFLNGTILLYPQSLDVRGSIEGEYAYLSAFTDLLDLSDSNLSENVMRLDDNIKSFW